MSGPDPGIHPFSKEVFFREDGSPVQVFSPETWPVMTIMMGMTAWCGAAPCAKT
jgi:hypothetical protein